MGMLVFDSMIVMLTFGRTEALATLRNAEGSSPRLFTMCDGNLKFREHCELYVQRSGIPLSTRDSLSSIMISRFMLNLRDPTLLTNNRASAAAYLTVAFPEVRITTVEPYYGTGVSWTEEYDSRWFHLSNSNEGEGLGTVFYRTHFVLGAMQRLLGTGSFSRTEVQSKPPCETSTFAIFPKILWCQGPSIFGLNTWTVICTRVVGMLPSILT
ncbi:hypothetical protein B0H13DRAFT_2281374 [Mycena leptocephala]|nr:hypothetical protein B0H13DRAFT_2281374 [Mycena leptocephala]